MKPIIDIENITKIYQIGEVQAYMTLRDTISDFFLRKSVKENSKSKFLALKNVSFKVNSGEVIGLIGKNGAGKSTLLKILSRITYPEMGKVTLRGRVASLLEVGTGFSPELTGRENIFLNGTILGMTRKEIVRKFDEIVDFSGIEKFLDTPVKRYSSGMYMRLAFSIAANLESEILLVDEVLAVGDGEFQRKCLARMEQITQSEGRTIIYVSHNLLSVQKLCKRAVLLEEGKLIRDGKTSDVIEYYLSGGQTSRSKSVGVSLANRTGNFGNVRVTSVCVSNALGHRIIKSTDKLKIVTNYTSDFETKIADVRVVITIVSAHTEKVVLCFDSNISSNDIRRGISPRGKLECCSGPINLAEGKYYVDIYFHIHGSRVDVIEKVVMFEVRTNAKKYGYVNQPDNNICENIIPYKFTN